MVVFHMGTASAQTDCPGAPAAWDAAVCNILSGSTDVCQLSGSTWTCNVSSATADGALAVVVDNYQDNYTYEAWGNINGTLFCCTTQEYPTSIVIIGSDNADTLAFTWDSLTYNLGPAYGHPMGYTLQGEIQAGGGNDTIRGSDSTTSYSEILRGEGGDDNIHGYAGDDEEWGGSGDDTMFGGDGPDLMYGESGSDTMLGQGSNDEMYSGDLRDFMSGGDGDDYMDGGGGGDVMCGNDQGTNGDHLIDGDDDDEGISHDILWAALAADTDECGDDSTEWDGNATEIGTCGATRGTPPALCP